MRIESGTSVSLLRTKEPLFIDCYEEKPISLALNLNYATFTDVYLFFNLFCMKGKNHSASAVLLVMGLMLFSLVGCQNQTPATTPTPTPPADEPTPPADEPTPPADEPTPPPADEPTPPPADSPSDLPGMSEKRPADAPEDMPTPEAGTNFTLLKPTADTVSFTYEMKATDAKTVCDDQGKLLEGKGWKAPAGMENVPSLGSAAAKAYEKEGMMLSVGCVGKDGKVQVALAQSKKPAGL